MKRYNFGLRGHDIGDNFEEMCKIAKANGVNELQFALAKTVNDVDFDTVGYDPNLSQKIRRGLVEHNLHTDVLGCYINPVSYNKAELITSLTRFKNFIMYAKDFDADVIGTETGCVDSLIKTRSEDNYKYFIKNLEQLVIKAEDEDVTVAIEPVWHFTIHSPESAKRMIDDMRSDNLAVILDVSNMIVGENRNEQKHIIDRAFELLNDRIKVIHLKDFAFEGETKRFAAIRKGELEIEYLFDKVREYDLLPKVILDETKINDYLEAVKNLEEII